MKGLLFRGQEEGKTSNKGEKNERKTAEGQSLNLGLKFSRHNP